MTFQPESKRLPYYVLLAVRMAVTESNLIAIYNRLPGRKPESRGAIQNYTKGDERVFTMTILEVFVSATLSSKRRVPDVADTPLRPNPTNPLISLMRLGSAISKVFKSTINTCQPNSETV